MREVAYGYWFLHLAALLLFTRFVSTSSLPPHHVVNFERQVNKRDSGDHPVRISFKAFEIQYRAIVWPVRAPLHHHFRLLFGDDLIDHHDMTYLYVGHLLGNKSNEVHLCELPSGGYIGKLYLGNETLYLEPAVIHLTDVGKQDVIVYKASDVDALARIPVYKDDSLMLLNTLQKASNPKLNGNPFLSLRSRREIKSIPDEKRNRCPLKIVADYKFFVTIGKKNHALTTRYIVNMIANVNEIYRRVNWDIDREDHINDRGRFHNLQFSIKEMKILDRPSTIPGHYNDIKTVLNGSSLLEQFTYEEGSQDFCLVPLLTAQALPGELGVAYVALPGTTGAGLCAENITAPDGKKFAYNTLFTTAVGNGSMGVASTRKEYSVVSREAEIVLAHEFGHSWGARHDDDFNLDEMAGRNCLPPYKDGGFYIMNKYAQNGFDANNNYFSPCSIASIWKNLRTKWKICFEEERSSLCGNGVVEEGEECDEGSPIASHSRGHCCTRQCRFAPSAVCSPLNHPCCSSSCSFLNSTHSCLSSNPWQCKGSSYCTGTSAECPVAPSVPDGAACVEEGECRNGRCVPYCERRDINKKSCICEQVELSCRRCCRPLNGSGSCEPQEGASDLRDGSWCIQGTCKQSKCVDKASDYMQYYLVVFQDRSKFWPFISSNIVGIVVILSLFIWCPCSYCIYKWDRAHTDVSPDGNLNPTVIRGNAYANSISVTSTDAHAYVRSDRTALTDSSREHVSAAEQRKMFTDTFI